MMKGQLNASKCFSYEVYSVLEKDKGAQHRPPAHNNIAWTVTKHMMKGQLNASKCFSYSVYSVLELR